jgi:hypothetical protein
MYYVLLGTVMPEFDQYLVIYNFSDSQNEFNHKTTRFRY